MRRVVLTVAVCLFLPLSGYSQSDDEIGKIAAFLGVISEEDLSEDEVEYFTDLIRRPLKINMSTRSKLLSSGLFSSYQVATLIEHQKRTGMVFSLAELASIDGFGSRYVELLRPFISIETSMTSDALIPASRRVYQELSLRAGYRYSSGHQWQYGLKYGMDAGCGVRFSMGISRGLSAKTPAPSAYSISAAYDFKKIDARLILGDFNARFGQGSVAWNGTFMNPLTSPSGFMKKASGLSSTRSFTGSSANVGMASELAFGRFTVSASVAFPGLKDALINGKKLTTAKLSILPLVNIRWATKIGSFGVTSSVERHFFQENDEINASTSLDASLCIAGVNVFAETAYDWILRKFNVVAGVDLSPIDQLRIAALGGWKQNSQWQFATSANLVAGSDKSHSLTVSSELLYYPIPKEKTENYSVQVKSQLYWAWKASKYLIFRLKASDRFRTWGQRHRTEVRSEFSLPLGSWTVDARMSVLKCRNHALLGHLDASYKIHPINLHLRVGVFKIDHWDDRIYVYEYDAPGSFNVPAYHGRGVWSAAVFSYRIQRYLRIYFRASYIAYPFRQVQNKKPGRAELKIQSVFRF